MTVPLSTTKNQQKIIRVKSVSNVKWLFINNDNTILSISYLPSYKIVEHIEPKLCCRSQPKLQLYLGWVSINVTEISVFGRYHHSREAWNGRWPQIIFRWKTTRIFCKSKTTSTLFEKESPPHFCKWKVTFNVHNFCGHSLLHSYCYWYPQYVQCSQ